MKCVVILYDSNSRYATESSFGESSAKQLCELKIREFADSKSAEIVKINKCENVSVLISSLKTICEEKNCDYVIFSYDDLPFFDGKLTEKLVKAHEEYKAEYTYGDGYPYGFTPEIIDKGALSVLEVMVSGNHKSVGENPVTRDCIYNLLKTEINSFEVEAVLAEEDWRLLRLGFHCGKKENYLSCVALYNQLKNNEKALSADEVSEIASRTPDLLKTVPGFYNLQIADYVSYNSIYTPYNRDYEEKNNLSPENSEKIMSYENFASLIDKIAEFSDTAVVSFSAWGEAFANPHIVKMIEKVLSYEGLSVYIETDGYNITENLCKEIAEIVNNAKPRTNGWSKFMISVSLDAVSSEKYKAVHKNCDENGFEKALDAITKLSEILPDSVYPQFVRMNENEDELENFFRYWNDSSNPSKGNFIIQKYDNFCGELPDRKPADLAPLLRTPCWHLRRDLTILSNGDVPLCRSCVFSNIVGNVFQQTLEDVWGKLNDTLTEHINKIYNHKCGKCDEYYTFNF